MPTKNTIKTYVEGGYYHLFNRGVDKRNLFEDQQDYQTFLYLLQKCLTPEPFAPFPQKSFSNRITLLAYCLMPNHFHLLVKQTDKKAITDFIRKICTTYSMYFNKKYQRVGTLFESRFKASLIDNNIYLLYLTKYIHQNPLEIIRKSQKLEDYPYSSYSNYLLLKNQSWVKPKEILDLLKEEFGPKTTYRHFVEDSTEEIPLPANPNFFLE